MPTDKHGEYLSYNTWVSFIDAKDGVVQGKIVDFTENGDVFVDRLVLKGKKTWIHKYYRVRDYLTVKIMRTSGTQAS